MFHRNFFKQTSAPFSFYDIPGYNLLHVSRDGRPGGGVAIYLHQKFQHTLRTDLSLIISNDSESIFIEINAQPKNIIIGVIYRLPDLSINSFNKNIANLTEIINNDHKIAYLSGDFNINLLNTNTHKGTSEFLSNLFQSNFYPLITRPTRTAFRNLWVATQCLMGHAIASNKNKN